MIRPMVKVERGRAGHTGPDATATVRVIVRDARDEDLRAIVLISEGADGITRITVTPATCCEVRLNADGETTEVTT